MIVTIFFLGWPQKIDFRPKNRVFGPQKGHFGQLGPRNGLPSGQTTTNQKTKDIQSYLRIWGTYDPIELGLSEPKKWGFHRCSVKKCRILGRKCSFLAQNPFFSEMVQIFCYYHDWTPNRQHFCVDPVARWASGRLPGPIFCPKFCIFLRYTYETPIFLARMDPTQLDHKSPIS